MPQPFTTLVVQDGTAVYALQPNTDRTDLPGTFTHKLTGNHGITYGTWIPTSGRAVRVRRPGWSTSYGVHGTFYVQDSLEAPWTPYVKGWSANAAAY